MRRLGERQHEKIKMILNRLNRFTCLLQLIILLNVSLSVAQNNGLLIDYVGATRDNSAVLDVRSTNQGVLLPRLTTAQRTAIPSPADGLLVYDTDINEIYRFDAASNSWKVIQSGNSAFIQNQSAAQQASSTFWISGSGRLDNGLTVGSGATIDNNNTNLGSVSNGALAFGNASGEGIGSKRSAGGNAFGLDFYTNSTNRLAITNTGNIGIGTTAPTSKLDIQGNLAMNSNQIRLRDGNDGNHYIAWVGGVVDGAKVVGNQGVVIANTSGGRDVAFFKGDYAYFGFDPGSCCSGWEKVKVGRGRNADGTVEFMNNGWGRLGGTNGLAFWANGNADVDDSPQMYLGTNGVVTANEFISRWGVFRSEQRADFRLVLQNDRNMVLYDGGAIWSTNTSVSDIRTKKNIRPLEEVLPTLLGLSAIRFEYKEELNLGDEEHIGVIAQEILQHYPDMVYHDTVSDRYIVHYEKLSTVLLKGIQELYRENEKLLANQNKMSAKLEELTEMKAELVRIKSILKIDESVYDH